MIRQSDRSGDKEAQTGEEGEQRVHQQPSLLVIFHVRMQTGDLVI